MRREQFEHTIRAAGAILGVDEVLVTGSQAVHASVDVEIPEAQGSIATDISALDDPDGSKADLIDGSIGEASMFQETFGYYAQGVTPQTAVLPAGWKQRLVRFRTQGTGGVTALCLELHDLWISKAIAGRSKAIEFCNALLDRNLVMTPTLCNRLKEVGQLDPKVRAAVSQRIPAE